MDTIPIVYLVSTLKRSGPIQVVRNLIAHLPSERYCPSIITLSSEEEDSMLPDFQAAKVPVKSLSLTRLKCLFSGRSLLKKMLNDLGASLVHSHGLRADVLIAGMSLPAKRVCTLHNYPYADYTMKFGRLKGPLMAWQHVRALSRLDGVIACSQTIANLLNTRHLSGVRVVQNGVDDSVFLPATPVQTQALRQKLRLPPNKTIMVSVGSLIARKDPETVLRGFLGSQAAKKSCMVMLGSGNCREACEQLAAGHDNIRLVGQVANVVDYLQAADIFVSGSHSEGLPNTVLEALACGLSVCLSDIPQHREILAYQPGAGMIFPPGRPQALADTLDGLCARSAGFCRDLALDIIHNHLSARVMSRQYQCVYDEFLQSRAQP